MRLDAGLGWKGLALLAIVALGACGGGAERDGEGDDHSPTGASAPVAAATPQPSPTPTPSAGSPTPAPTPTPATTSVAYTQDVLPIFENDCVRCHSQLGSYSGAMAYVVKGSASSRLVRATQSGGSMNRYLSGDKAGKAELIRRWVVENAAAESR